VLCSLYSHEVDLPSTQIELYERRFELLLGAWDTAKRAKGNPTEGPPPMPRSRRLKYWHFLMALSLLYHKSGKRSGRRSEALELASQYYDADFHHDPDALLTDCIHRGLLEIDEVGNLSFGHLTYQEFLVARSLNQDNPIDLLWEKIGDSWWLNVCNFYAEIKGDLTLLLDKAIESTRNEAPGFVGRRERDGSPSDLEDDEEVHVDEDELLFLDTFNCFADDDIADDDICFKEDFNLMTNELVEGRPSKNALKKLSFLADLALKSELTPRSKKEVIMRLLHNNK